MFFHLLLNEDGIENERRLSRKDTFWPNGDYRQENLCLQNHHVRHIRTYAKHTYAKYSEKLIFLTARVRIRG